MLIGTGLAVVTFFIFRWAILRFDIKTPGREESSNLKNTLIKEKRYGEIAEILIEALGGKQNIRNVDNCITRMRIDIAEVNKIDKELMSESGCTAFFFPSANHVHVVYGPKVEFVRNAVDEAMKK